MPRMAACRNTLSPSHSSHAGGVLYGTHGPVLLVQASGLAILGSTAAAAAVLVSVRWRRKHRPALLPSSESFDKLPVGGTESC